MLCRVGACLDQGPDVDPCIERLYSVPVGVCGSLEPTVAACGNVAAQSKIYVPVRQSTVVLCELSATHLPQKEYLV